MIEHSTIDGTAKEAENAAFLKQISVLYIEDEPVIREQFASLLRRRVHEVFTAENGEEGLQAFKEKKPDLIITDILMPVMDGLSMSQKIKDIQPDMPIIVTSAHSETHWLIDAIESGIDHYLIKPIKPDALQQVLLKSARAIEAARKNTIAETVLATTSEAICILDGEGRFIRANPAFHSLRGKEDDITNLHAASLLAPHGKDLDWETERKSGGKWHGEVLLQRADGSTFPAIASLDRIPSFAGTENWSVLVFTDITNYKLMEEDMRRSESLLTIGQLTGQFAHEFNNILTAIIGNLELVLLEDSLPKNIAHGANAAFKSANNAAKLIEHLLSFGQRQTLIPKVLHAGLTISDLSEQLCKTLGFNIQLKLLFSPDLWKCNVDPFHLRRAVLNLAENSRDAMPDGGILTIESRNAQMTGSGSGDEANIPPGNYVVISVTDTGCGIAPDIKERIFEPFFSTKEVMFASGLGLCQVYGFAKQSEGHILCQSEPGKGSTFRIYLKRAQDGENVPQH